MDALRSGILAVEEAQKRRLDMAFDDLTIGSPGRSACGSYLLHCSSQGSLSLRTLPLRFMTSRNHITYRPGQYKDEVLSYV